ALAGEDLGDLQRQCLTKRFDQGGRQPLAEGSTDHLRVLASESFLDAFSLGDACEKYFGGEIPWRQRLRDRGWQRLRETAGVRGRQSLPKRFEDRSKRALGGRLIKACVGPDVIDQIIDRHAGSMCSSRAECPHEIALDEN